MLPEVEVVVQLLRRVLGKDFPLVLKVFEEAFLNLALVINVVQVSVDVVLCNFGPVFDLKQRLPRVLSLGVLG